MEKEYTLDIGTSISLLLLFLAGLIITISIVLLTGSDLNNQSVISGRILLPIGCIIIISNVIYLIIKFKRNRAINREYSII